MLRVSPQTVELLYQAQRPQDRGRVRLDLSPTAFPLTPERPYDLDSARQAIGERLLQFLGGLADDAVLDAPSFPARLPVLSDPQHFTEEVACGLVPVLGLDSQSAAFQPALARLAFDLYTWASTSREDREAFELEIEGNQVYVRCHSLDWQFAPLEPAEENVSSDDLKDFFQRHGHTGP